MSEWMRIKVAVPRPLFQTFDYLHSAAVAVGARVRVPFAGKEVVGVVLGATPLSVVHAQVAMAKSAALKAVQAVLDEQPLLDAELLGFLQQAARYYQHPLGEVIAAALPNALAQGGENQRDLPRFYALTLQGEAALSGKLSAKQQALLSAVQIAPQSEAELRAAFACSAAWLRDLVARGWLSVEARFYYQAPPLVAAPELSGEQAAALDYLAQRQGFAVDVLDGVTGSGKTEVYIRRIEQLLAQGGQVLLLAPEIALVEMLYERLRQRLPYAIAKHHSAMSDAARLAAWQAVQAGDAQILIGTRSALFSAFAALRGIIIDECHDQSYKQQDGFHYHARDMAVLRAKRLNIPVLMGSATPPLEVWAQMQSGAWGDIRLTSRVLAQAKPLITIDDMNTPEQIDGLSFRLIAEMHRQLQAGNQVMLFLNRRGYAPLLRCEDCGAAVNCSACDSTMTAHMASHNLQCHHCGRSRDLPSHCSQCGSKALKLLGYGTQRLEQSVGKQFPQARLLRIDSDAYRSAVQFQAALEKVQAHEVDIILGTQWLSKGHHFPKLQLVAVVDADAAFYSSDFRAEEHLAQTLLQVGGRAGREGQGHIWVQTRQAAQPIFRVFYQSYRETLHYLAAKRQAAQLPPYAAQVLLTAQHREAARAAQALQFTAQGAQAAGIGQDWLWLGPAPALMQRKNGQHRYQLLLQAKQRSDLQQQLPALNQWLLAQGKALNVRVAMDVDPLWLD